MPMIYIKTELYNEVVRRNKTDEEAQEYINKAVKDRLEKEK